MCKRFAVVFVSIIACACCCRGAFAQCDNSWEAGPMSAPLLGADGPIFAIWAWSLPGQPTLMIVGGEFTHIGGIAANNIAAWDGQIWHALGGGFNGPVYSLTTYNAALIAAGNGFISAWNGSTWTLFGTPYPTFSGGQYHDVLAMAVFNGELYVGGDFLYISTLSGPTGNLWKYNGTNWSAVGGIGSGVRAMQVFDPDGVGGTPAALYYGGDSTTTCLRKWDGTTSTAIDGPYANTSNVGGAVYALTVVNPIGPMPGGLIVGGSFAFVPNPSGGNLQADDIARWDGTRFHTMTTGVNLSGGYIGAVRAFGTDLYVGGGFAAVNGGAVRATNIARYNGTNWFPVGGGLGNVMELREFNGALVAGGAFSLAGGGNIPAHNIARWSGFTWSNFSEPFSINALARVGTRIVIGGGFNAHTAASFPTPAANRRNIMTWDLNNQGGLGWGTNGTVRALTAYTLGSGASASNHVVAGGDFTACGPDSQGFSITANRVAIWSEDLFTIPGWSPMGSGFNNTVNALERFAGNTVAGGSFTPLGAMTANRLAKYVGSPPSWQPLTSPDPQINGIVRALKSFSDSGGGLNSYLIVGGDFTGTVGGAAANRIVLRKESPIFGESQWQALGQGFNGPVFAIERHGSNFNAFTYAAGTFTNSGTILNLNRIARLNGANWEKVGVGGANGGFNGAVYALKSFGGFLYAAGSFTSIDGIPVNGVAKWNGTVWSDASGGANGLVAALMPYQTELIAGGAFNAVQSGTIASPGVARLKATGVPWILSQPLPQTRDCLGQPVYFSFALPEGYETATFQWRRNDSPLTDGPTGTGSQIFGAQSQELAMYYLSPSDAGAYDCVVTNACGSATTIDATLTVNPCCYADINGDDMVNVTDLLAVISAWGPCSNCPAFACSTDIAPAPASPAGGDCQTNVSDLLAVISAWGACP